MNWTIVISGVTAFVIGFGGSIGVVLVAIKGQMPDTITWISACAIGAVTAAKDVRSLLKLPPVGADAETKKPD